MTADEDPAALLRRAAAHLRGLAGAATPGPWRFDGATGGNDEMGWPSECTVINAVPIGARGVRRSMTVIASGVADENIDTDRDYLVPCDAAWIAALNPALAEPLAAWLELEAGWAASTNPGPQHSSHAEDFAHALLGETATAS